MYDVHTTCPIVESHRLAGLFQCLQKLQQSVEVWAFLVCSELVHCQMLLLKPEKHCLKSLRVIKLYVAGCTVRTESTNYWFLSHFYCSKDIM